MMREKITFIRVTPTQGEDGDLVNQEQVIYQPSGAEVQEVTPSMDLIAQQANLNTLIRVKIRYNPEIPIRIGDKIEWRGFRFNSLTMKVDPRRTWVMINAMSEMETTQRDAFGDTLQTELQEEI